MADKPIELGISELELAMTLFQTLSDPQRVATPEHTYIIPEFLIMEFHINALEIIFKLWVS